MAWRQIQIPWLTVKNIVDTAAIVVGVATAVAVFLQFRDLNRRENQKKVEEWQTAAVYQTIESARQISFKQISDDYVKEAKRSQSVNIPTEKLSDAELSLVLVRLIQSQAVIETGDRIYSPKTEPDPILFMSTVMNLTNNMSRDVARSMAIGWQVLSEYKEPRSVDEMKHDMIKEGANQKFLDENMPIVLQQMQMQGYLRFLPGGRVMPSSSGGFRVQTNELPAELQPLKGQLDGPLIRVIMTSEPMKSSDICFPSLQDYDALNKDYRKAAELGLLDVSDQPSQKNCAKTIRLTPTRKLAIMQNFLYGSALGVLGN